MADHGTAPARIAPTCAAIGRAVLGEPARKARNELFHHCPNHDDQHPSLLINPVKNCWICGPCGRSGGAWDLIHFLGGPALSDKRGLARWLEDHGLGHSKAGQRRRMVAIYSYCDEEGKELFQQVRYEPKAFKIRQRARDGKWIWNKDGVRLVPYNLAEVTRADEVYITEGEKDAENLKLWGLVATTNPFGAGKWRAEFNSHFRGKLIRIIPDFDPPGKAHAFDVARNLLNLARDVKVVHLPELPPKGDFTDWRARGGSKEKLLELVAKAPLVTAETLTTAEPGDQPAAPIDMRDNETNPREGLLRSGRGSGPYCFEARSSGVYCVNPGLNQRELWICSPLEVLGRTLDKNDEAWGVLVSFRDLKGTLHQFPIPSRLFAGDGNEYRAALLDAGLSIAPARQARELLSHYLQTQATEKFIRVVTKLGWNSDQFVLPPAAGPSACSDSLMFQPSAAGEHYLRNSGTLDEWTRHIAALCRGNSRLVFAVSCGFAGPLLARLDAECGGFHLLGGSSQGKSTALMVGGSVLGGGGRLGFCRTWRSTVNGLETIAEHHNDLTLFLDELNQADPADVIDAAYMLANGQGKIRSGKTLLPRAITSWRLLFLSSGEVTLAQHALSAGRQARAGAQVRLINVPAEAGAGYGIFEDLHLASSPQEFAKLLHANARRYHGTPIRAFVDNVQPNQVAIDNRLRDACQAFVREHSPTNSSGETYRMADCFAVVAAAGELATEAGITGWDKGEATQAAARCFRDAIKYRGGPGPADISAAIDRLRALVKLHGASRFQVLREKNSTLDGQDRIINRAGFRGTLNGEPVYHVFKEVFRGEEVCRGTDPRAVAAELAKRRILIPDENHLTRKVSLPGLGRHRVYTIVASRFEDS